MTPRVWIEPVARDEDGGTGDRWIACWSASGGLDADYDGSGVTVEEALANLARSLGDSLLGEFPEMAR